MNTPEQRRQCEALDRQSLRQRQLQKLNHLLAAVLPHNRFYARKLAGVKLPLASLDDLAALPFTTKDELLAGDSAGNLAANLTYPLDRYVRYHQTSGTRGTPLAVLDTSDDWPWWLDCWQFVLDAAAITAADRLLLAFSFGPFIGFWSAFDAAVARGALVIPGGGMNTLARLKLLESSGATGLFCTPSYALHLAEEAANHGIETQRLGVGKLVLAGEPGGSAPATRQRLETAWNARVTDHAGATEVGPWGYGDAHGRGLHVLESEFIAEFLPVESQAGEGGPIAAAASTGFAAEGRLAELVLTNLGRVGCPVLRYRTGDLVRPVWQHGLANRFVLLDGGVLGRADDMLIIRGVNIFPSAIEEIIRGFPEIAEYRVTVSRQAELDQLEIEIEDALDKPDRVAELLRLRLGLKVRATCVPAGSLPRFEGKGRRFVDQRASA